MVTEIRAVWNNKYECLVNGNNEREITHCEFNLVFKFKICYTEMQNFLQFTLDVWKSHP